MEKSTTTTKTLQRAQKVMTAQAILCFEEAEALLGKGARRCVVQQDRWVSEKGQQQEVCLMELAP